MIETKKNRMYTTKRKKIVGGGFVDTLKGIGSYIYKNKDLLAKPMLEATGNIGAIVATEGARAIIEKCKNKKKVKEAKEINEPTSISHEILNQYLNQPVGNIMGSGIKKF